MENKLKVKVSLIDDKICVLTIFGELTIFSNDFDLFVKEVNAYMKMGIFRFILDLTNLNYIDSSGIGVIIRLATNASKHNTKIITICNNAQVLRIFSVSNIDKILKFVKSVNEGLEFYNNDQGVSQ